MDLGAPGLWGWGLLAGAAGFFPFNIGSEISWVTAFSFLKAALLNVNHIPLIPKSWIFFFFFVRELHHHFPFMWSTGSKNMKKTDLVKYWKCSLGAWEWGTDSHFHHFYPWSQKSHPARLAAQPVPSGNFFLHALLGTAAGQLSPPLPPPHFSIPDGWRLPMVAVPPHLLQGGLNLSLGGGEGGPFTFPSIFTYSLSHHPPRSRGSRYFCSFCTP